MSSKKKKIQNVYTVRALALHKKLQGKIAIVPKQKVKTLQDLSTIYTPGVGAVASYLAAHPREVPRFTIKGNSVAIVSDGSAVLGLGNIGPAGAMPVMEGKAVLFKELAGIDAFPLVLDTQDTEAIIATVKNIAPVFGGINLEDIAAPRCFAIETRLIKELAIPVMHDDQHGTAVVVLAGLLNAFKVVKKDFQRECIVIVGAGAAGAAITKLLFLAGARNVMVLDSAGIIYPGRPGLSATKMELLKVSNKGRLRGDITDAVQGAAAVVGVSGPGIITPAQVASMAKDSIVFALANPIPEIMPEEALKAGACVVATGRSDFPNQVNNALGFPGIFRGALDNQVRRITDQMKLKAAQALASLVNRPTPEKIIPGVFDKRVVPAVAKVIR